MSNITHFDFNGIHFNVLIDPTDEEVLFACSQLQAALEVEHLSRVVRQSVAFERGLDYRVVEGNKKFLSSNSRRATFLTESGLYKAIMRSNSPSARDFQNKVSREILPSIRIHGCYPPPAQAAGPKHPENAQLLETTRKSLALAYRTGHVQRYDAARAAAVLVETGLQMLGCPRRLPVSAAPVMPGQLHLRLVEPEPATP